MPEAPALRPRRRPKRPAADPAPISDAPQRSSVVASREPPPVESASVVVALSLETAPDDPAVARLDLPAIAQAPAEAAVERPRGIGETGWFLEALDPDALSDIDVDGVDARRRRDERPAAPIDASARRQFSLGGPEAAGEPTLRDLDLGAPPARASAGARAGLLIVACLAAVATAWWFTR
ncbi:MAG: hypothetical protein H6706_15895 [Myxococcales bacterium]|nr:hypothetical protein [Myxococcales bacterium]